MSKRYREVLQVVETQRTRDQAAHDQAAHADAARTATVDVDAVDGAEDGSRTTGPAQAQSRAAAGRDAPAAGPGTGSAVATLVRPLDQPPSISNPDEAATTSPPPRAPRRPGRPGNGPPDADQPLGFSWRGRHYDITRVLGHWREEEGWWRRPDGEPIHIEQSDLWRVEAVRDGRMARDQRGVYELSRRGQVWRLDRVWD